MASNPSFPTIVFGPISRANLALYAGASGDHNPIHIDSDYAKAAGQPDVFAQGLLSMGLIGRVVEDWAKVGKLRSISTRFLAQTFVGDIVTCTGTLIETTEVDGVTQYRVQLAAQAQDGRMTISGEAVVID